MRYPPAMLLLSFAALAQQPSPEARCLGEPTPEGVRLVMLAGGGEPLYEYAVVDAAGTLLTGRLSSLWQSCLVVGGSDVHGFQGTGVIAFAGMQVYGDQLLEGTWYATIYGDSFFEPLRDEDRGTESAQIYGIMGADMLGNIVLKTPFGRLGNLFWDRGDRILARGWYGGAEGELTEEQRWRLDPLAPAREAVALAEAGLRSDWQLREAVGELREAEKSDVEATGELWKRLLVATPPSHEAHPIVVGGDLHDVPFQAETLSALLSLALHEKRKERWRASDALWEGYGRLEEPDGLDHLEAKTVHQILRHWLERGLKEPEILATMILLRRTLPANMPGVLGLDGVPIDASLARELPLGSSDDVVQLLWIAAIDNKADSNVLFLSSMRLLDGTKKPVRVAADAVRGAKSEDPSRWEHTLREMPEELRRRLQQLGAL